MVFSCFIFQLSTTLCLPFLRLLFYPLFSIQIFKYTKFAGGKEFSLADSQNTDARRFLVAAFISEIFTREVSHLAVAHCIIL